MLDFRRKSRISTPNYLARPQQFRLLMLIMTAGLVMILIGQAARPANWRWIFLGEQGGQANLPDSAAPATRLKSPRLSPEMPDSFLALRDEDEKPADSKSGVGNSPVEPTVSSDEPELLFPGLRSDELKTVRDDTVLRGAEHDAWFHLLELLEQTDQTTLRKASTGEVTYVQLFKQPRAYRGRLVTVRGVVRGVREITAAKNEQGIDRYYQLSLEPEGGPAQPIIIYALHLPAGFPQGMNLEAVCSATGFFYKRWAYQAQDGIHTAPLILARTVDWQPPTAVERFASTDGNMLIWVTAGSAVLALIVAALLWNRSRQTSSAIVSLHANGQSINLDQSLRDADLALSVEENLRQMSESSKL